MEKLGIGIIGCGNISEIYFSNIPRFDNISQVAAADIDLARAEAKAEKYGIKAMTVDDLIEDPEINIVLNLTIPQAHYEIDMKALRAGKHVYSEKPL
ncbi:MAG: Gfo/Idh/MocA family oxidoreductase, partial [Eubacterium sp.]|nr:Gfo/Idh/MocA family oxidoreductase [Eubacterium sp.]